MYPKLGGETVEASHGTVVDRVSRKLDKGAGFNLIGGVELKRVKGRIQT